MFGIVILGVFLLFLLVFLYYWFVVVEKNIGNTGFAIWTICALTLIWQFELPQRLLLELAYKNMA